MPFFNKSPSPVAAMMREVEGLRLKDRDTVTEGYKYELSKPQNPKTPKSYFSNLNMLWKTKTNRNY